MPRLILAGAVLIGALGCVPPPAVSLRDDAAAGTGGGTSGVAGTGGVTGGGGAAGVTGLSGHGGVGNDGGTPDAPDGPTWVHHGPGGPNRMFTNEELFKNCAFLEGGPGDVTDEHDIAVMFDGYLLLPWAPEFGKGGMTFYDVSDPCAPVVVGVKQTDDMRETHTVAFSNRGGVWAVTDAMRDENNGGILIWDVSDPTDPKVAARLDVPGFHYPDGYAAVVFWAFWQGRYLYLAAGDNGIVIVDTTDPRQPTIVKQVFLQPFLRANHIEVIGNLLFATQSSAARAVLLDVSDPTAPQPIPGGDFTVTDRNGTATNMYASNFSGGLGFFTKQQAGGVNVFDLRDPTQPRFLSDYLSSNGAGAYVFVQEPYLFVGDSNFGTLLDMSDPANLVRAGTFNLTGDLDFVTPIGNVVVLSVDEHADPDHGSGIAPWRRDPDRTPPRVTFSVPRDGATALPVTSRIGVTFSEFVDAMSAWRSGAVRLRDRGGASVRIEINVQDTILNVTPLAPLAPLEEYTLEIPAGVVEDWSGNAITEPFSMSFETAPP